MCPADVHHSSSGTTLPCADESRLWRAKKRESGIYARNGRASRHAFATRTGNREQGWDHRRREAERRASWRVCAATEAGVGRYLIRLDTMWQRRATVVLALPSLCARLPSSSSDLVGLSGSLALFDALDRAYVQRRASLRRSPQSRPRHLPLLPLS